MNYTIEITQHTTIDTLEEKSVYGADIETIARTLNIDLEKDYKDEKYVKIMVPETKTTNTVIYRQSLDSLNLSELIITINKVPAKTA